MADTPQLPHPFHVVHDDRDGRSTTVSWRWRQVYPAIYLVVAFHAAFALLLLSAFAAGVLKDVLGSLPPLAWMEGVELLPVMSFTGVGYVVAAWLLNRTFLEVDGSRLRVRHAPLPWPGGQTFRAAQVSGVLIQRSSSADKIGSARSDSDYDLYVVLNAGRRVRLLWRLPEFRQAKFLEQCIVKGVLGIQS